MSYTANPERYDKMEYRRCGNSGLKLPAVSLGLWHNFGHIDNFDDPLVDCKNCQNRMRADHLLESFGINADKQTLEFINSELDKLRAEKKLVCTNCGKADLTSARSFSR